MFRAMTLNLNHHGEGHGAWPARRALIEKEIRRLDPHVIALQAVERPPGAENQAEELSRALPGYVHVWFEPAVERDDGSARGMAFLARVPLDHREAHRLTQREGTDDTDPRIVLRAHCAVSGGIDFFNAHFSWVDAQADDNIRDALPFLRATRAPALLLGDFNQTPERPLHAALRDADWVDAWPWLRGAEPGPTFEAGRLESRIDYAYANARLRGRLADIERVGLGYAAPPRLSDHLGLVVTLGLG